MRPHPWRLHDIDKGGRVARTVEHAHRQDEMPACKTGTGMDRRRLSDRNVYLHRLRYRYSSDSHPIQLTLTTIRSPHDVIARPHDLQRICTSPSACLVKSRCVTSSASIRNPTETVALNEIL